MSLHWQFNLTVRLESLIVYGLRVILQASQDPLGSSLRLWMSSVSKYQSLSEGLTYKLYFIWKEKSLI